MVFGKYRNYTHKCATCRTIAAKLYMLSDSLFNYTTAVFTLPIFSFKLWTVEVLVKKINILYFLFANVHLRYKNIESNTENCSKSLLFCI